MPYIEEIKRRVSDDTKWTLYYHSENEQDNLKTSIESIDVSELIMSPSAELWDSDR